MSKALIEKAQEYAEKNVIFRGGKVVCGMAIASAFTSGATWQREQLEKEIKELKTKLEKQSKVLNSGYAELDKEHELELKAIREQLIQELREAGEIIGELLATAKGYELEHRKDKLYTVRQRIERGDQFLAKLDLLEGRC